MSTRPLQQAIYETICDRCGAVRPDDPSGYEWTQLRVMFGGNVPPPVIDLCLRCRDDFSAFMVVTYVRAD